jgi:hypothetical protein
MNHNRLLDERGEPFDNIRDMASGAVRLGNNEIDLVLENRALNIERRERFIEFKELGYEEFQEIRFARPGRAQDEPATAHTLNIDRNGSGMSAAGVETAAEVNA